MHNGRIVASELPADPARAGVENTSVQTLKRDDLDTLFANLVQFGTPMAPVPTLKKNDVEAQRNALDA